MVWAWWETRERKGMNGVESLVIWVEAELHTKTLMRRDKKKWMRQCLLVAEKEVGGVFVSAFKCFATAEAVWWDLSWERRLQSKRTLLIFSSRIPPLHQPPLVFFSAQATLKGSAFSWRCCASCLIVPSVVRKKKKQKHSQGYPSKILALKRRRIHSQTCSQTDDVWNLMLKPFAGFYLFQVFCCPIAWG